MTGVMSPEMTPDESLVVFSSKELFIEVNRKLDLILAEQSRKADRAELERVREQVNQLELNGSNHAREALKRTWELDKRVDTLDRAAATKDALDRHDAKIEHNATRMKWVILGLIVNALGVGMGILMLILRKGF